MSTPSREALVAEAEKVNAERTPLIAWLTEMRNDCATNAAYFVECGHMAAAAVHSEERAKWDGLLSLLHADAAKVQELEAKLDGIVAHTVEMMGTCETHADQIRQMPFHEYTKVCPKSCHWCDIADRDRLAAEVERLMQSREDVVRQGMEATAKAEAEVTRLTAQQVQFRAWLDTAGIRRCDIGDVIGEVDRLGFASELEAQR